MGPNSLLMLPPAENRGDLNAVKGVLGQTSTGISLPRYVTFLPRERTEASGVNCATGTAALL